MIVSPPLDFIRLPRTLTIFGAECVFPARALAHPARHALRPRQPPPTPESTGRRIKGWYKDPYDPEFDAMASYSGTDDVKYDDRFRKHALSRIRATFPDIVSSIQIANLEDATSAD